MYKAVQRVRMSAKDAHYGGGLVDGAHMIHLFGDVATELMVASDGDEGLFRTYEHVDFLAPVFSGDWIEAVGWYTKMGNTSRLCEFEGYKYAEAVPGSASAVNWCDPPKLVAKASGWVVVPKKNSRGKQIKEDLL